MLWETALKPYEWMKIVLSNSQGMKIHNELESWQFKHSLNYADNYSWEVASKTFNIVSASTVATLEKDDLNIWINDL